MDVEVRDLAGKILRDIVAIDIYVRWRTDDSGGASRLMPATSQAMTVKDCRVLTEAINEVELSVGRVLGSLRLILDIEQTGSE